MWGYARVRAHACALECLRPPPLRGAHAATPPRLALNLPSPPHPSAGLRPLSSLPGPPAHPLWGNLREFMAMPAGQPRIHALWSRLARDHGPLYRVRVPGKTFVIVTDPALLPPVLGRPGLPKTPMYRITRPLFSADRADNMFTVLSIADPGWSQAR